MTSAKPGSLRAMVSVILSVEVALWSNDQPGGMDLASTFSRMTDGEAMVGWMKAAPLSMVKRSEGSILAETWKEKREINC